MKNSLGNLFAAALAVLVLTSFALTPVAEAARGGGGGGARAGGGGGGAHAGGGGGARAGSGGAARQNTQINNNRADVRTNNVRSTSVNNVNNVNVNRNVNVNVEGHGGCCYGGWDNNYHPVATAAAVTAAVGVTAAVIGSMVPTVPAGCVPVNYGGLIYQQCGATWYQPQGGQYVVINPPY